MPPPFAASASASLQGNEGVHVQTMCTNCNSANIDLGGLGGDLLPIDVDGYEVIGGLSTIYALNVTPPALLGNISIEKGPGDFSALPEAIGGAIHIRSTPYASRPVGQATGEAGSFGWVSGAANATFDSHGFSLTGLYVHSQSDPIDANGDGFNESGDLHRHYAAGEASYRFQSGLSFTGGLSRIREDAPDGHGKYSILASVFANKPLWLREDAFVRRDEYHVGLDAPIGQGGTLKFRALRFVRDQQILDPISLTTDPLELTYTIQDRDFAGEIRYEQLLGETTLISAGIERRRQVLDVHNALAACDPLRDTTDLFQDTGADAGIEVDLSPAWHLRAGARYDDWGNGKARLDCQGRTVDPVKPGTAFAPRSRVTFKPGGGWSLALAAGSGSRAARPVFEEVCCGQQYQSNSALELEHSYGGSLEAVWQPNPRARVGAYVHRTIFRDHILRMVGTSLAGIQVYIQGNVPRAEFTGLTLTSRLLLPERLIADLAFSWLDAINTTDRPVTAVYYPFSSPFTVEHDIPLDRIPYHPSRTGSAQIRWTEPRSRYDLVLQAQYQGPMPIQHWNSGLVGVKPAPQEGLLYGLIETPSFWVVNARLTYRPGRLISLFVGVDNISDYVQSDLTTPFGAYTPFTGDTTRRAHPSTDYNWGPIRGRYTYGGISFTL